ncbi:peptidyl-dipeptidase Dcp [Rhizomicrobium palustre]|uniref:Dipeptidyl carboxypeptidase n=1 Tax=Rhizomicrobium palustre TaxID=189966 RepID=A0A846MV45_9PROT|nr:M3 family metallopeptidase [Rhizomicrobium palustre]NIK86887.1 peptidyl-dipeptidase Dcp [Rhizomicrobium palustre]
MLNIRPALLGAAAVLTLTACSTAPVAPSAPPPPPPNPFAEVSSLPLQAPDFGRIKDSDFQPAIEQGMKIQLAEIEAIANNPAAPTLENTIVAIEKSGAMLTRASKIFFALAQSNTNPELQKVKGAVAPKLAAHHDAIFLNDKLFARVKAIYDQRASLHLDAEDATLLDVDYLGFVQSGAQLSPANKVKLMEINQKLSSLETVYDDKLLAATKAGALVVDDKAKLAGLSDGEIAAAQKAAEDRGLTGKWMLPLRNTTQQPALQSLNDREVRQAFFEKSWTRAEKGDANDTRATIAEIADLRAEKAALLGYPNWAAYKLQDQMAKTPEAALAFLGKLAPAAKKKALAEAKDIQAAIKKSGGSFKLEPWDWQHYAEEVRKAKYNLNDAEVKPYFEMKAVLEDGVFYAANKLYGITFKERKDIPVYQADVRVFEVFDKDGSTLGLMYFDWFKRDNKAGGAWMDTFVDQSKLLGTKPVVFNVCNFTKPAAGDPALMSFDDVRTAFHEFGHALHGLFASQKYPTTSGTAVARDVVEFPSQFNEHWALYPEVLKNYAKHYKTHEPIPDALVAKIKKAQGFNQGYALTEAVASSELDLKWHFRGPGAPKIDVDAFEADALKSAGLALSEVPPRYRSSYFTHIWSQGYSAGYYAYQWAEMLDHDAYSWFEDHGGLTRENGQRFRDMILSKGHTMDYGEMFRAFYGKDPDIGPYLYYRGLSDKKSGAVKK